MMKARLKDSVTREQFDNLTYGGYCSASEFFDMVSENDGYDLTMDSGYQSRVVVNGLLYTSVDIETLFDVEE